MKKYALECLGTFAFVLLVTGPLVLSERAGELPSRAVMAILYGFVLAGLVLALGKYTGANVNPAVTIAFSVAGRLPWKDALPYLLSQCIGALAASALLKLVSPLSLTLGTVLQNRDDVPAFTQEFSFTLILLVGILSVPRDTPRHRRLSAGITGVIASILVYIGGPVAGSGMNPARALAPALFSGQTDGLWIYLTAPLCAAFSAAALHSIYETIHPGKTG